MYMSPEVRKGCIFPKCKASIAPMGESEESNVLKKIHNYALPETERQFDNILCLLLKPRNADFY